MDNLMKRLCEMSFFNPETRVYRFVYYYAWLSLIYSCEGIKLTLCIYFAYKTLSQNNKETYYDYNERLELKLPSEPIKTKYLKTGFSGMGGFHDTTMEDSSMRIISQVNFVGGETGLSTEVLAKVKSAKQMILEEESASDLFEGDEEDPGSSTSSPLLRSNSPPKVEMESIPV